MYQSQLFPELLTMMFVLQMKQEKKFYEFLTIFNYKPNLVARNFVKKTSYAIGLILPDISDEFFTDIIRGVDEITYKNGYYTMVASSHKHRTLADSIATFSQTGLVGGVILINVCYDR